MALGRVWWNLSCLAAMISPVHLNSGSLGGLILLPRIFSISLRVLLTLGLLSLSLLSGCDNPLWALDDFAVTGEFIPGGACAVLVNKEPLFSQNGTTERLRSNIAFGVVPQGYIVHQVTCRITPGGESLLVWLTTLEGVIPQPGSYRVSTRAFADGDTSAVLAMLTVSHFGGTYLEGTDGVVEFTHIAPDSITGTFKFQAVRRQGM